MKTDPHFSPQELIFLATKTPIAIFVYRRPEHTRRLLDSLAKNLLLSSCPLVFYCDGPDNSDEVGQVRKIVEDFEHPEKIVIRRPTNYGLARSVIEGVSFLCRKYGRVIVLEDDLIVSPQFLSYMCASLEFYKESKAVMQISGHTFEGSKSLSSKPSMFLPFISSWGWGTWERSWRLFDSDAAGWRQLFYKADMRARFDLDSTYPYSNMLIAQMLGLIDSWAIRWNWAVFKEKGLVLFPPVTLIQNGGNDGTGTHCRNIRQGLIEIPIDYIENIFPDRQTSYTDIDQTYYRNMQSLISGARGNGIQWFLIRLVDKGRFIKYFFKMILSDLSRRIS